MATDDPHYDRFVLKAERARAESAEAEVRALRERLAAAHGAIYKARYRGTWHDVTDAEAAEIRAATADPTPEPETPRMMQSVWPAEPGTATVAMDADDPVWNADPTPEPETP